MILFFKWGDLEISFLRSSEILTLPIFFFYSTLDYASLVN